MSSEKSLAIVLRVIEFSETSCVVTLFTREFGKISAIAKGARRPKSAFEGALDLLAVCRIVFIHKTSDVLDILTEAKLEQRFRAAAHDLTRLYAGYYVAEVLQELTDEDDPHPALFDSALQTLGRLDARAAPSELQDSTSDSSTNFSTENALDVAALVLRFELRALTILGHLPSLSTCASCGGEVETAPRYTFGQLAVGVVCEKCRPRQQQVMSISRGVLETMRRFAAEDDSWRGGLPEEVRGELRGVVNHYIATLLGKRPRMHGYLGVLAH